ncbi:MAG: hypothetical protein HWE34_00840 [Methylocystaceae bacterium]|nr:hypothetical protein [Methylocystaceae bacterium]
MRNFLLLNAFVLALVGCSLTSKTESSPEAAASQDVDINRVNDAIEGIANHSRKGALERCYSDLLDRSSGKGGMSGDFRNALARLKASDNTEIFLKEKVAENLVRYVFTVDGRKMTITCAEASD